MASKFNDAMVEVLKENAPKRMKTSEILKAIAERWPELGHNSGPLRSALLNAAKKCVLPIRRVPDVEPPLFYYGEGQVSAPPVPKTPESAGKNGGMTVCEESVTYKTKSMFFEPALAILKEFSPAKSKAIGAAKVTHLIIEQYPDLKWCHSEGAVRAALIAASKKNCPIRMVAGPKPPLFYYDKNGGADFPSPLPEQVMASSYAQLNEELTKELLKIVRGMDDFRFEDLVNGLLERMGFGKAKTTQRSHDKGIDGFIYGDRLGLNVVCVQAKHFGPGHTVGLDLMHSFLGAIGSNDGVFVTSSTFTKDAREAAEGHKVMGSKIALIDGPQLVSYMIEFNYGVEDTGITYRLKKLDADFLADFGADVSKFVEDGSVQEDDTDAQTPIK